MNSKEQFETLNDLILINNARIESYQTAIDELNEETTDLEPLFQERIEQSHRFHNELMTEINKLGKDIIEDTQASGKVYRAWSETKSFFTGGDNQTILNNCEDGETAVWKAYESALKGDNLTPEQRTLLLRQQAEIKPAASS